MLSLKDKVALVTGCGSLGPGWGNGKATTTLFARQGATVIGVDMNLEAAKQTQSVVEGEGNRLDVSACDVTRADQVNALVANCLSRYGRIDILVNNVGRSEPGNPVTMDEATWDEQIDINLKSVFLVSKFVLPGMAERRSGAIVNVSSVAGLRFAGKDQVAYAAAKAGVIQFTRVTAVAFADKGVRLNCVVPGLMDTPLVRRLADRYAKGDYEGMVAKRHAQVPMGHMGDAWDVAHAALFLSSDEARYVTGTEIVVDGGFINATR